MLSVVLDTSVLVAALRSHRGASHVLLRHVADRALRPLVSTPLFLEYEAVLKRPEQQLATGMTPERIDTFLAAFASAASGVETHFRWRPQLRDSADELVFECAVNGRADYLVTHNLKDFSAAADKFALPLRTPGAFLREIDTP